MESLLFEHHYFSLRFLNKSESNEIKIHCNICNEFFHCGIAGECRGKDCILINSNGTQHRASYCINCVTHMYEDKTCLCKDCSTK